MTKPLDKIKYGEKIVSCLTKPMFFDDIRRFTSLDAKTLQTALNRLVKHGYLEKDSKGLWVPTEVECD